MNNDTSTEFLPEFPISIGSAPFNVTLMDMHTKDVSRLRPTTSLDMFEGATRNFHPDGLWSIETFGRVGSRERNRTFSYIELHTEILHPYIYAALKTVKSFYIEILSSKSYAVFNPETRNFEPASRLDGDTGFSFFMRHWDELDIPPSKSSTRNTYIDSINKYKGSAARVPRIPVAPAGMRDVEIGPDDRVKKNEVNDLYYRVISISNTIVPDITLSNPKILDTSRMALQNAVNAIYLHYEALCRGKEGMFQKHWGGRAIVNGTRNVITAMDPSSVDLDSPRTPSPLSTQIGLYQLLKGCLPVAKYHLRTGWLSQVFTDDNADAYLVDPKTYKRVSVPVSNKELDMWTTDEGLDNVIRGFAKVESRQQPILVAKHYLGLIYVDDTSFRIFGDIDELPSYLDRANVHPLTYTLLLYLSGYTRYNELVCMLTRYPVIGLGSTYTAWVYTRTTNVAQEKHPRNDLWQIDMEARSALEFPTLDVNASFVDSLIPHTINLSLLDGDYDGDTASANIAYSDLALQENKAYYHTVNAFLDPNGEFALKPDVHTINLVLHNMTGFQP